MRESADAIQRKSDNVGVEVTENKTMSNAGKRIVDVQEQPGVGCMDSSHLDSALRSVHTSGHCVPCWGAVRDFGKGSTVAHSMAQEHIRHMNTTPRRTERPGRCV
jgi:hypothetical protein